MRTCKMNSTVITHYTEYAADGYTKLSGQVGEHSAELWLNGVAQGSQADLITLSEIGTTGCYLASFRATRVGLWHIEILVPANKKWWGEDFECRQSDSDDKVSKGEMFRMRSVFPG